MTDQDDETFARFAGRFARIEPLVADRPRTLARRRSVWSAVLASAGVAVAVLVIGGVVLGGRLGFMAPVASQPTGDDGSYGASPGVSTVPGPTPVAPSSGLVAPGALVPLDPAEPPEELPPPCFATTTMYDRMVTTPAEDAARSVTVLVGRVTGVGAAQWNTAGGRAPATDHPDAANVMRLLRIEVEETIRGKPVPSVITIWIPGGTIGCHQFDIGGTPRNIAVGDQFVVLIGDGEPRSGLDGILPASQLWPTDGTRVTTEFDPNLPLAGVLEQMRASPRPSEAP